jgi:hypothetical protein
MIGNDVSAELTYGEFISALSPLWDALQTVEFLQGRVNGPGGSACLENLHGQLGRAINILTLPIAEIEQSHPELFGDEDREPVFVPKPI